jgi:hypothetical protein
MVRYLNDIYTISETQLKMIELFPEDCADTIAQVRDQIHKKGGIPEAQTQLRSDE